MTDKIPEALAVLDEITRGMDDFCQIKYGEASPQAEKLRKVRAVIAELIAASKSINSSFAVSDCECDSCQILNRINKALAAVEKLS